LVGVAADNEPLGHLAERVEQHLVLGPASEDFVVAAWRAVTEAHAVQ
jgi:hypothetical protein